ncbi:TlyA family RNA methyltransferase [Eubacteriales bacterium OttesenSCG-928-K08]|nr:TlyA family RNA methyltransferase [Eubacteriales bacterium OttesenSCG-928-K08]
MRIDALMFQLGLTPSREKAHALILAGKVIVDGKPMQKPGTNVSEDAKIEILDDPIPYVSRGGLKLQKALDKFNITVNCLTAVDVGASTGGFTDCMLQNGAKKVYAIDVGYGQLDWKLRNDPRVVVMERRNARAMNPDWFDELPEFATIDVSFISTRLIFPALYTCLKPEAYVVALIKPQFEAGRSDVGKNGVVRDPNVHIKVCEKSMEDALSVGFHVCGLTHSPITGPKGNIEFLALLQRSANDGNGVYLLPCETSVSCIVAQAHKELS